MPEHDARSIPPAPVDAPPPPPLTDLDPVVLDVRPFHERGEEPFAAIMGAVEALPPAGALLLINSFEPTPLFRVMERKGFTADCRAIAPDEFHILFTRTP